MSGVEPLTYLITNYAVLHAQFFPKRQHFQKLTHDLPARMDLFSFARFAHYYPSCCMMFPAKFPHSVEREVCIVSNFLGYRRRRFQLQDQPTPLIVDVVIMRVKLLRRFLAKAATTLGASSIPPMQRALKAWLIENIQHRDVHPMEEANAIYLDN